MKRKDLEDLDDDFSLISLSSTSRKSRRLDGDFLSIMQQDPRSPAPQVFEQPLMTTGVVQANAPVTDAVPASEERALVLYNPSNTLFLKSPHASAFSVLINSELIPGLKDHTFQLGNSRTRSLMEDQVAMDESTDASDYSLAVVPWVAPRVSLTTSVLGGLVRGPLEPLEAEEVEMMDMEDNSGSSNSEQAFELCRLVQGKDAASTWQQQQHMVAP